MSIAGVEGMWESEFLGILGRAREKFRRIELRRPALGYLRRLLNRVDRKNSWQMPKVSAMRPLMAYRVFLGAGDEMPTW